MPSAIPTDSMASSTATEDVAPPMEEESRVFVKNLPPNITEDQLRKHFSGGDRHITDVKLIARRRIAFVGYRSPGEAKGAIRYFNRSFIRMSKLSVEIAKPISDPSLPTAHKMKRLHELHAFAAAERQELAPSAAEDVSVAAPKKRKRDDLDAATNPKLREFLEVMQTQNKGLSSSADVMAESRLAGGTGVLAVDDEAEAARVAAALAAAEPESEKDEEYQYISAKKSKTDADNTAADMARPRPIAAITATSIEEVEANGNEKDSKKAELSTAMSQPPQQSRANVSATDDDWMRSRTNRLLDLLDPSELAPSAQPAPAPAQSAPQEVDGTGDDIRDGGDEAAAPEEAENTAVADALPTVVATQAPRPPRSAEDQIRETSRLFVRNLPYDATDKHIRAYFKAFGSVEEVGYRPFLFYFPLFRAPFSPLQPYDEPQIGTAYAYTACDVILGPSILVDASLSEKHRALGYFFAKVIPITGFGCLAFTSLFSFARKGVLRSPANLRVLRSLQVQLPVTNTGANKGYAMVQFADPAVALATFHNADGKTFQGRILHVLPAKAKKTAGSAAELDEFALSKLPLKQQRLLRKKADAAVSSFSWNALFMNQDAVNAAMAERLGVSKSELLDPTSSDEAVRQAVRQTSIIEETKDYFESNGVDLESFKPSTKRGDTCILVKNFAYGTTSQELRKLFEEYGPVVRVLMPPSGTTAIVQFAQAAHGRLAYSKMAYRRVNDTVLMLEKCPENLLGGSSSSIDLVTAGPIGKKKLAAGDLLLHGDNAEAAKEDVDADANTTSSLFVRNLNFSTTTEQLATAFSSLAGFVAARVKTKPDPKRPGQVLSMGYGFVEFRSKADAAGACQAMDGHILHGHTLMVQASHRGTQDAAAEQRATDQARRLAANRGSKLVIKNVPFEASRKDLRTLLGTYGQLQAVRMPKKFGNNATRGYAFAEFVTAREAVAAMTALRNTHLLGRRLVIDFAEAEAVDAEEEIAKMQKKVGSQVNSMAMQQLATSRSHRAKVHIGEEDEEDM